MVARVRHLFAETGVSTAITVERGFHRGKPALAGGTGANTDDRSVSLGVEKQTFLTRIEHLDRALCHIAEQGNVYLSGYIFLAAKTATHQGCNDTYLFGFQSKRSRRLIPVQVGYLAADID